MKKYINPELVINLISNEDVLAVSTGSYANEDDNIFNWANKL